MELLDEISKLEEIWDSETIEKFTELKWTVDDFQELTASPLFQSIFTEKILRKKFRSFLKPFNDLKKGKKVYCKYNTVFYEEEGEKNFVFSALTDDMIAMNKAFFTEKGNHRNALDLLYKPYLYELNFDYIPNDFLHDYEEDTWYEVILTEIRPNKPIPSDIMAGHLSFAASPLETKTITAEWKGKLEDNLVKNPKETSLSDIVKTDQSTIDTYCKNQNSGEIDRLLDELFNDNDQRLIRVFRVGQANAVSGWNRSQFTKKYSSFLFDIGLPEDGHIAWEFHKNSIRRDDCFIYDDAELSSQKPNVIFISHWHRDHYKAAYIMNRAIFSNTPSIWLAPKYLVQGRDYYTTLLVRYLVEMKLILFVEDTYQNSQNTVTLYRVKPPTTRKTPDLNHDCILLELNSTLLTGDCFYSHWPSNFGAGGKIENVIVPHHGSKTTKTTQTFTQLDNLLSKTRSKAVICAGLNPWGHPDQSVSDMYKVNLKFGNVFCTKAVVKSISPILIKDL